MRNQIDHNYYFGEIKFWDNARSESEVAILVEAKSDETFFKKLLNTDIKYFAVDGYENVIEIFKKLNLEKYIIGIIDADFRRCNIVYEDISMFNIFLTDYHDKEMMMFASPAWYNLTSSYLNIAKKKVFERQNNCLIEDKLIENSCLIAYYKYINVTENLSLKFKTMSKDKYIPLDYSSFIDINTLFIDEKKLQTAIENKSNKHSFFTQNPSILNNIDVLRNTANFNSLEFCNGHDLVEIFSFSLKKCLSNDNISSHELEKGLIIAYRIDDFVKTNLYNDLLKFATQNPNFNYLQ